MLGYTIEVMVSILKNFIHVMAHISQTSVMDWRMQNAATCSHYYMSAMFRDSKIISRGCSDSCRICDYAVAYRLEQVLVAIWLGLFAWTSYRDIVSLVWNARRCRLACAWVSTHCRDFVTGNARLWWRTKVNWVSVL